MPDQLLQAVVEVQLCTKVFVRIGSAEAEIRVRVRGGLTGSRLAGALARIPAEDAAASCHRSISKHGYKIDQDRMGIALWVDNCFTFGNCLRGAIDIQESFERALAEGWGLSIKDGSRSCLVPAGCQEAPQQPEKWPVVTIFGVLGHHISNTGAIRPSWDVCRGTMWRAFFRSFADRTGKKIPTEQKVKALQRSVRPVFSYKCSLWPPQVTIAKEIDGVQRKMLSLSSPVPWKPDETAEEHARRQTRQSSRLASQSGLWSKHWIDRALAWDEHVRRNHVGWEWNNKLLNFHNATWLCELRSQYVPSQSQRVSPWTILAGRTGTRAMAGKVQPRWEESINRVRVGQ